MPSPGAYVYSAEGATSIRPWSDVLETEHKSPAKSRPRLRGRGALLPSCQGEPATVEEMRRMLREHISRDAWRETKVP